MRLGVSYPNRHSAKLVFLFNGGAIDIALKPGDAYRLYQTLKNGGVFKRRKNTIRVKAGVYLTAIHWTKPDKEMCFTLRNTSIEKFCNVLIDLKPGVYDL